MAGAKCSGLFCFTNQSRPDCCTPFRTEEVSFRMGDDGEDDVFLPFNFEVESPVPRHPGLPDVEALAIFLRLQGRMPEIGQ